MSYLRPPYQLGKYRKFVRVEKKVVQCEVNHSMNNNVQIVVATHKKYRMPDDEMYLPLHVGAEGKVDDNGKKLDLGYVKDNTGDNISNLNASFCELTGLYWAWKNLNYEYIGIVHYRRHFGRKISRDPWKCVLTYEDIKCDLGKVKIFVPQKRWYIIETLYSHYAHTHYANHLDETKNILQEKYPEYVNNYNRVIKHRYGYMFNMMIMERCLLNDYCSWLFDILFDLKEKIQLSDLSAFQSRCYGRVSEILLNVWLDHQLSNGRINLNEVKELPCIHMEKINWWKKGKAFLKAKYFGKKYEGSF